MVFYKKTFEKKEYKPRDNHKVDAGLLASNERKINYFFRIQNKLWKEAKMRELRKKRRR